MEKLFDLPPLALVTLGATLAVIFAARYLGLMNGERSVPINSPAAAQVAAVIVDSTALNKLTNQAARLNETFEEMNELARERIRVDRMVATELDRIREELRIQSEVARRSS
ncbi:hypothetical protein [Rhizobium sp. BG4]|uniref:hypothetical protein n=1 Tax=Rhizobium sp. BG4 TaxID=2613770 RepID=UPI00193E1817|nr:hypothetical protein [Rhizobium sp. BG4]QRM43968.1 hypothetical protein F2982_11215 [Rhizobium sp. BG4]